MSKSTSTPAAALKAIMDDYQITPTRLAKDIHMSQSAIRQIAIGQTIITVPVALRLAKYFNTTPGYWIDLQTDATLSAATKDPKITAILKDIPKAKTPGASKVKKSAPAAKPARTPRPKKA
jgi:addiction module HigA family antidote